ncbi:MAG: OmpH family outer membrane protein [Bacteroidota bacterium]
MNKVLIAVNAALVIAVGVLFYQVNAGSPATEDVKPQKQASQMPVTSKIAFIRNDSVTENYEFIKEKKKQLEALATSYDRQVQSESNKLQQRYNELMQKAATMTQEEGQKYEMELQQGQQKLQELRYKLDGELTQKTADMQKELLDKVKTFLKKYNEKQKFDYILSYADGGGVLLAKDTLDITSDVVNGLNAEHLQAKKAK